MQPQWQLLQCRVNLMVEVYKYEQLAFQILIFSSLLQYTVQYVRRTYCVFPLKLLPQFSGYCAWSHYTHLVFFFAVIVDSIDFCFIFVVKCSEKGQS